MIMQKRVIFTALVALLLILAPEASAQSGTMVPNAITVVGEGSAAAPADTADIADIADIAITIGADSNIYIEPLTMESGTSTVPDAVDVTAVVDAIIAYGIPVNDMEVSEPVFTGEWGSGMSAQPVTMLVHITNPTVDGINELLEVVRTAAHAEGLFVNQFGVVYGVEDCRVLRQQARVEAVESARTEAEDQAAAMNTTVGNPVASRDTYPVNMIYSTVNTCNGTLDVKNAAYQFDPGQPAEVIIVIAVEMSFELP